jgi:16S rRNA (guanine(966)-N(2))-methyltransferase RsmD
MPTLRVISGKARGRKLRSVPGDTTRPITDRTKESLFNIIGPDIVGAAFLDLFAGTGSVGIEALSRGAAFAFFTDINHLPVQIIQKNLKSTNLQTSAKVAKIDAFKLLGRPPDRRYDYVYIAPPQYKGLWIDALLEVDNHPEWLSEDAWVIVQIHPLEEDEMKDESYQNLALFDRRVYGSTLLLFFERVPAGSTH